MRKGGGPGCAARRWSCGPPAGPPAPCNPAASARQEALSASSKQPRAMELTKKEKIAWLRTVPLFKEVSPRSLALIADKATVIEYPAGRYIVRQGQVGTGGYLIIRGGGRGEGSGGGGSRR